MIPEVQPVKIHYGNNEATQFDFEFYVETEEHLLVEHTDMSGVKRTLEYGVDYSVEEFGMPDGSKITFPLEDSEYGILAWDDKTGEREFIVISLNLPFSQEAEFDISGDLNKKNLETALDYEMRCIQILNRKIDRAIKVEEGAEATPEALMDNLYNAQNISEQSAKTAKEQAEIATEKAEIATAKANDTVATHERAINEIEELADTRKNELNALDATIKKDADAIINRVGFNMFDTVVKDYILTYEESKGLALQGTWVYKDAIVGERYGYPDFYNKCVEEFENAENIKQWLKSNVNYVGSVVDNQGVLSGFGLKSWVTLPNNFSPNSNNWEMFFKFTTGTIGTRQNIICSSHLAYQPVDGYIDTNGYFVFAGHLNDTSTTIFNIKGTTILKSGATYYVKCEYNSNTGYSLKLGTDKDNLTLEGNSTVTTIINNGYNIALGADFTTNGAYYDYAFTGSIDLKESYININGERWWTGADTLEYKKNSNGHLFYDIAQKDHIDEIFTSTGMAWMYGVDQENERVFLPRDNEKLHGSLIESHIEGTNWYRVYSDGWCEQGGRYTAKNGSITFLKPYINTNYTITESFGMSGGGDATVQYSIQTETLATTGFSFKAHWTSSTNGYFYWRASGYIQSEEILTEEKHLYLCVGNTISDTSWVDVVTQVQNGTKDLDEYRKDCIKDIAAKTDELNTKLCFNMFDTVTKDHILTYEESKGLALQGTYVHKNPVAGSVYGYAGFYRKCLEEYSAATTVEEVGSTTVKVHSNGHKFYDIADKDVIDEVFNQLGSAWFYGIDTENERICLPRNNNRVLVESKKPTATDSTWYNLYSDGWLEQGGLNTKDNTTITLLKPYRDTKYSILLAFDYGSGNLSWTETTNTTTNNNRTVSSFTVGTRVGNWQASGYAEIPTDTKQTYTYICVGNTDIETTVTEVMDTTTTQNDTVPLFTGMYFDFTPDSLSWIKAGEQKHSGGIYKTCYNELVSVLNGSTKYGNLKVVDTANMISGVDYSAYWKVNQAEMLFIAPDTISARTYESIAPVVGNGTTLGLTNGGGNFGVDKFANNSSLLGNPNAYGVATGSSVTDAGISSKTTIGVTIDPEKSGIEAHLVESKSGQLYFKVANAVQNLELLDAKQIMKDAVLRSSLSEVHVVVETYQNAGSWYRVYSDGWCEQGGDFGAAFSSWTAKTVTFLKPFRDTHYFVVPVTGHTSYTDNPSINVKTTTSFSCIPYNSTGNANWYACGYIW